MKKYSSGTENIKAYWVNFPDKRKIEAHRDVIFSKGNDNNTVSYEIRQDPIKDEEDVDVKIKSIEKVKNKIK